MLTEKKIPEARDAVFLLAEKLGVQKEVIFSLIDEMILSNFGDITFEDIYTNEEIAGYTVAGYV